MVFKGIFAVGFILLGGTCFAKQVCIEQENKKTCYRDLDLDLNGPYQERYDDGMKASGKWAFVSSIFFTTTVLGLGASYYTMSKWKKYDDIKKERELTDDESREYCKWDQLMATSVGVTAGSFIFGIVGYGVSVHYEKDAHAFATKVGIDF